MDTSRRLALAFLAATFTTGAVLAQEPQRTADPSAYEAMKKAEDAEMQDVLTNGPGKRFTPAPAAPAPPRPATS